MFFLHLSSVLAANITLVISAKDFKVSLGGKEYKQSSNGQEIYTYSEELLDNSFVAINAKGPLWAKVYKDGAQIDASGSSSKFMVSNSEPTTDYLSSPIFGYDGLWVNAPEAIGEESDYTSQFNEATKGRFASPLWISGSDSNQYRLDLSAAPTVELLSKRALGNGFTTIKCNNGDCSLQNNGSTINGFIGVNRFLKQQLSLLKELTLEGDSLGEVVIDVPCKNDSCPNSADAYLLVRDVIADMLGQDLVKWEGATTTKTLTSTSSTTTTTSTTSVITSRTTTTTSTTSTITSRTTTTTSTTSTITSRTTTTTSTTSTSTTSTSTTTSTTTTTTSTSTSLEVVATTNYYQLPSGSGSEQNQGSSGTDNTTVIAASSAAGAAALIAAGAFLMRRRRSASATDGTPDMSSNNNINPLYEGSPIRNNPLYASQSSNQFNHTSYDDSNYDSRRIDTIYV